MDEIVANSNIRAGRPKIRFDDILPEIGEFGAFQKLQYGLLCLPAALSMIYLLLGVFTLGVPKHRCDLSYLFNISVVENYTNPYRYVESSQCEVSLGSYKQPLFSNYDKNGTIPVIFRSTETSGSDLGDLGTALDTHKCTKWDYDTYEYDITATSEFHLVCDATYLRSLANMLLIGGVMLGTLITGGLADRYGRKPVLYVCSVITGITSFASAWSPNIYVYMVLRFLTGLTPGGMYTAGFIIAMEMVGPSKRTWLGVGIQCACSVGSVLLVFLAYFIRNWRHLQIAVSLISVLIIPYWWIVPESARWLLAEGHHKEAKKVLRIMAKRNGTEAASSLLLSDEELSSLTADIKVDPRLVGPDSDRQTNGSWLDVFKSKVLLPRALVVCFCWLSVSLLYFGLSMNAVNLEGNLYLNFFIMSIVEMPANVVSVFILNYIGRRKPQSAFMGLGGISCLGCFLLIQYSGQSLAWLLLVISTLGKFAASVTFGVVWIYATELFPTVVRSFAIGVCNTSARLGNMMAPFVVDAGAILNSKFGSGLPQLLFGIIAILAGLISLVLPETKSRPLPETIEQGENLGWASLSCSRKKKTDMATDSVIPESCV